jgi:hypothetical protein
MVGVGAMDQIARRNRLSLDRLRAVAGRLSHDDFLFPIDPPWTAAALFAHVAFWDRFTHHRWLHAGQNRRSVPVPIEDFATDLVNHAALPQWLGVTPDVAVQECLEAAETFDRFIRSLDRELISRVFDEGRPRLVDRSIHRSEHLDTIQTAFPNRG